MPVTRSKLKRLHVQSTTTSSKSDTSTRTEDNVDVLTKRRKRADQHVANDPDTKSDGGQVHRLVRSNDDNVYNSVSFMTVHNDDLFLVTSPTGGRIEVYGMTDFTFRRDIQVDALGPQASGLTSCVANNCLYVTEFNGSAIHRVQPTAGSHNGIVWKLTGYRPQRPSVNRQHNLLVACTRNCLTQNAIMEYTTHGQLVREIILSEEIIYSRYAVQLNDDQFLVGHGLWGNDCGFLCVVDASGRVQTSYGQGNFDHWINVSKRSVVDRNGFVYTADKYSRRMTVLTGELKWSRDIKLDDGLLDEPIDLCYCLNESRDQLLLVEGGGLRRIVVLELEKALLRT